MKSKKIISSLLAALLLSATLVGCGSSSSDSKATESDKLDADQTLNILGYDYSSLDTSVISDAESFTSTQNIFEGLMREVSKDGKTVNELAGADKMTVNKDHTVYTFHIRDSKWSDGKKVTANDYVYSWRRLADKKVSTV